MRHGETDEVYMVIKMGKKKKLFYIKNIKTAFICCRRMQRHLNICVG